MADAGICLRDLVSHIIGTYVSLEDAALIMPAAKGQICYIQKHLLEMVNALKYLDKVLQCDKETISPNMLTDILDLCQCCTTILDSISSVTELRKRSYSAVQVASIFRKTELQELVAGLSACLSTFQLMTQTIVVAQMGSMPSQVPEDKESIILILKELDFLKALNFQQHVDVQELRIAEGRADVVEHHFGARQIDLGSLSTDDNKARRFPDITADNRYVRFQYDTETSTERDFLPDTSTSNRPSEFVSELLLRIVPRASSFSHRPAGGVSDLYLFEPRQLGSNKDTPPRSGARLLLDKWTVSGSGPIWDLLENKDAKDDGEDAETTTIAEEQQPSREEDQPFIIIDEASETQSNPPTPTLSHPSDLNDHTPHFPNSDSNHKHTSPPPRAGHPPPREQLSSQWTFSTPPHSYDPTNGIASVGPDSLQLRVQDVWKGPIGDRVPARSVGQDILRMLRYARGGINYIKRNEYQRSLYYDGVEYYRFYLLPHSVIPKCHSAPTSTDIPGGWACEAALNLLGLRWEFKTHGHFTVHGDLTLDEIEEIACLTFQHMNHSIETTSHALLDDRGWPRAIDILREESLTQPQARPPRARRSERQSDNHVPFRPASDRPGAGRSPNEDSQPGSENGVR